MKREPSFKRRVREITDERKKLNWQISALAKEAQERTITPRENEELIRHRQRHQQLGRRLTAITSNREYDPSALSRSRSEGKRAPQGSAGGIRSVAQGGAPGLGKRA